MKKKNEQDNIELKWILLIDELSDTHSNTDYSNLISIDDVDVLIAFGPNFHLVTLNPNSETLIVTLPKSNRYIAKRITFKYRYSLELNIFLLEHFVYKRLFRYGPSYFGREYYDKPILHKMLQHENLDCNVCQKEESKSTRLKIHKTKILHKEIIPSNQCWICNLSFQNYRNVNTIIAAVLF